MSATLWIEQPDATVRRQELLGTAVTFGRLRENDIVLEAQGVSRQHGRFSAGLDGEWWVEDLGSTNGTRVNDRFITRQRLRDGDSVQVGVVRLTFRRPHAATRATTTVTICEAPASGESIVDRPAGGLNLMDGDRLRALYEIARRLIDRRDAPDLIDEASDALITALGAEVVVFGLTPDPDHPQMEVRPRRMQRDQVTLSRSVLERTLRARRASLVTDTSADGELATTHSIVAAGIRSAICVPMLCGDAVTGFIYLDHRRAGRRYDERDLEFVAAVGAIVGTAIENARLHDAELVHQRIEAELASAREVQRAILPSTWPVLDGWDVHGAFEMCYEVGGDYYDAVVAKDGALWLVVADVAGKGVPASLLSSSTHALFHALIERVPSPGELLTQMNGLVIKRELGPAFVTCLIVRIEPATGNTALASAGHPYPIGLAPGRPAEIVHTDNGPPLGLFPGFQYPDTPWTFPAPGGLLLYTDGVTEALNDRQDLFGERRLLDALDSESPETATDAVNAVQRAVAGFRADHPQSDDTSTLACCRRRST